MRKRPIVTINIYVKRAQVNPLLGKPLVEYWGSTTIHSTCRSAASSVQRDVLGPVGVTAHSNDTVFARFDRRSR